MPFFRFLIHGRGEIAGGISGFYTTKWCYAATEEQAGAKALGKVRSEWEKGEYAKMKRGPLSLEIEEGYQISPFDIWKAPNKGHSFYGPDEDTPATRTSRSGELGPAPKRKGPSA